MRQSKSTLYLLFLFCTVSHLLVGQQSGSFVLELGDTKYLPLENHAVELNKAIEEVHIQKSKALSNGNTPIYQVIQFYDIPSLKQISDFEKNGISIVHYIDGNSYLARIHSSARISGSKNALIRASFQIPSEFKRSELLNTSVSEKEKNAQSYLIHFAKRQSNEEIFNFLDLYNIQIEDFSTINYGIVEVRSEIKNLFRIASHSNILYVDVAQADEPFRYEGVPHSRANMITNPNLKNLHGKGIVIGVGDSGRVYDHYDFEGRINNFSSFAFGLHATRVTGVITGFPNLNPLMGAGIAYDATILTNNFSDILRQTDAYIRDYDMVITNNSYGSGSGNCDSYGDYNSVSAWMDDQMMQNPSLLHIFSSGNSGQSTCEPYSSGLSTIIGGYQVAKNVLTVGSARQNDILSTFSSQGPTHDGRIKPEVMAQGQSVLTTNGTNGYATSSGTSFSCPATAGMAALLYEEYRILHNGENPDGALIKALLCNTADDFGNPGPDYKWGFGRIHIKNAMDALDNDWYIEDNISNGGTETIMITVPSDQQQLRVMLLWNDPVGIPYASYSLVNDLDLKVTDPSSNQFLPWTLKPAPKENLLPAERGIDRVNNYEQITIDLPEAGNYEVEINGFNIPMGVQEYKLVYYFQNKDLIFTYPINGEKWVPNNIEYVRWDSPPTENEFTVEYSIDNGANWILESDSISGSLRSYGWFSPDVITSEFLMRVSENGTGRSDETDAALTSMRIPKNIQIVNPCYSAVTLQWDKIDEAGSYKVYQFTTGRIKPIQITTDTFLQIKNLDASLNYWWSVSALLPDGKEGLRAQAISSGILSGPCSCENDLALLQINALESGRLFTSTELSSTEHLEIEIRNDDVVDISNVDVFYQINGGTIISENYPGLIPAGGSVNYTFLQTIDLSTIGDYEIKSWISYINDTNFQNDTIAKIIRQIDNPTVTLPYDNGFETLDSAKYLQNQIGTDGDDRLDLLLNGLRVRTFAGADFPSEGARSLTLDAANFNEVGNGEFIITLNLANYDTATNDLRFTFDWRNHEIDPDENPLAKIYIRGNDQDTWIETFNFMDNYTEAGQLVKENSALRFSKMLIDNGHNFSSSFQIKFGFEAKFNADQIDKQDGLTVDNLKIFEVNNDLHLIGLDTTECTVCLVGPKNFSFIIENTSDQSFNNMKMEYQVEGFSQRMKMFSIEPYETIVVEVSGGTNFTDAGVYYLDAQLFSDTDSYRLNDSIKDLKLLILESVKQFPFLETFEDSSDTFVADGKNSSWEWGEPKSINIYSAAEGLKVWSTNLGGNHNASEKSYLYSPSFRIKNLSVPALSFAYRYVLESDFDFSWVEYSIDGGLNWEKLGSFGDGLNWYNEESINTWGSSNNHWRSTEIDLPLNLDSIQFRWILDADAGSNFDGLAIDQVLVYDNLNIYNNGNTSVTKVITDSTWVDIKKNDDIIVSYRPEINILNSFSVDVFFNEGILRNDGERYLLDRSFVINSMQPPLLMAGLKLYVTNDEIEALLNSNDCNNCISHEDGFELAIFQYSGPIQDGDWNNNDPEEIVVYKEDDVLWVPYANGYYAEINVSEFSEFWIGSVPVAKNDAIEISVSVSSDDAEETNATGSINPFSEVLRLGNVDFDREIGLKFRNVLIPRNSLISSAYVKFTSAATALNTATFSITSFAGINIGSFNTGNYDITGRTSYPEVVTWNVLPWLFLNQSDVFQQTPNLKYQIQSLVSNPGWSPGKSLGIKIISDTGGREVYSFDGDEGKAPKLYITYSDSCESFNRLYVDIGAPPSQNGNGWANAMNSLHNAITIANTCENITEIWIKEGVYKTTQMKDQSHSFILAKDIKLYGGFNGTEFNIEDRNLNNHITYLDGEGGTELDTLDNAFHVVSVSTEVDSILIDGVHIINGFANGSSFPSSYGGGIYCLSNLHIRNCTLQGNKSSVAGASIFNFLNGVFKIEDCVIINSNSDNESSIYNAFGSTVEWIGNNFILLE